MRASILLYLSGRDWLALQVPTGTLLGRGSLIAESGSPDWGFLARLPSLDTGAGVAARVVVGCERCHFLSLPWSDELLDEQAAATYVRGAFLSQYGPVANAWRAVAGDAAYGIPRLACASDAESIDRLSSIDGQHGLRIDSIGPSVEAVFSTVRKRLIGAAGVLSFPDGAGRCVLRWEDGDVVEAAFLSGTDARQAVLDWQARAELDIGALGERYWLATRKSDVPAGWTAVGGTDVPSDLPPEAAPAYWSF